MNTPIVLIFFNRPNTLKKVFEIITIIKPKTLFLVQDGPRLGNQNDIANIMKCREIVQNISWECDVKRNYSEINLGVGERPHSGISWAFSFVDRAIILEDDCVPEISFFQFCDELLDRYYSDERIGMISGFNRLGTFQQTKDSYFFCNNGPIWGWATWKRVWDNYDFTISAAKDKNVMEQISKTIYPKEYAKKAIKEWTNAYHKISSGEKVTFWDYQFGLMKYLYSFYAIVPNRNLIQNIGNDGSHFSPNDTDGNLFFTKTYEMEFPLVHPKYIICSYDYDVESIKQLKYKVDYIYEAKVRVYGFLKNLGLVRK